MTFGEKAEVPAGLVFSGLVSVQGVEIVRGE
jgi:hypothetical protein